MSGFSMEKNSLREISSELEVMKKMLSDILERMNENELDISDEVISEVEFARKNKSISHEEVLKEFL